MPAIKQIFAKTASLNGAQKRLGHYLQTDSSALLLSNVSDLAQAVGVSKSTVVRFAKSLGYKGFPHFRREIQKEMRRKLRAASRMEETFAELGNDENYFRPAHQARHRALAGDAPGRVVAGLPEGRGDHLARPKSIHHRP